MIVVTWKACVVARVSTIESSEKLFAKLQTKGSVMVVRVGRIAERSWYMAGVVKSDYDGKSAPFVVRGVMLVNG